MKTKLIQKIKEDTSQEPKCIFDHSNTLQLVSVHQDDGTWYRYCYHCKWIDVKEIISQSKEELVEEIKKKYPCRFCGNSGRVWSSIGNFVPCNTENDCILEDLSDDMYEQGHKQGFIEGWKARLEAEKKEKEIDEYISEGI